MAEIPPVRFFPLTPPSESEGRALRGAEGDGPRQLDRGERGPLPLARSDAGKQPDDLERVREAAAGFEALLYREMVGAMRKAQLREGLFGSETGSSTWEDLFDLTLSESLAGGGQLGLADDVARQLLDGRRPLSEEVATGAETALRRARAAYDADVPEGARLSQVSPFPADEKVPGRSARTGRTGPGLERVSEEDER